jgi:predicted dienelactone hydrolase
MAWLRALLVLGLGSGVASAAFEVGATTLSLTKTSVTTGDPRTLATVVWYPRRRGGDAVRRGRHPLVVFSHGACGRPTESTYLTSALAARGFVVAAPSHPGNTADDGFATCAATESFLDSFLNRVPDVRFAIDALLAASADPASPFHRRLRTRAIGIGGLSFGGFTALQAAQEEPRIRAVLAMVPGGSAALAPGSEHDLTIPAMIIGAERDRIVGYAESELAFARLAGPRFLVKLLAANHLSVVDDCFNHDLGVSFCVAEDVPQEDAHRLVLHYVLPFFDRYLAAPRRSARPLRRAIDGVELVAEP